MSTPTRPTNLLDWADSSTGAQVRLPDALVAAGYAPSVKPKAQHFNYMLSQIYAALEWFDYNIGSGGGGGGGSALSWQESAQSSPLPVVENNLAVYEYQAGNTGQALVAILEVPPGYNAGSKIQIYNRVYSPDSSGTLLFQTLTTLIRTGIDPMGSMTNQHISTNAPLTLSSGTVNIPQAVLYDVTDTAGLVNGVAVSAGDLLIIELLRGVDTAQSSARSITFATLPTFS